MSNGAAVQSTAQTDPAPQGIHPEAVAPLRDRGISEDDAHALASVFATLADGTRVRLLHLLTLTDELCVGDLALLVGISESAVSHQLRLLRDRRVVSRRREGRIVYYRLSDDHMQHVLADGLNHVAEPAATSSTSGVTA